MADITATGTACMKNMGTLHTFMLSSLMCLGTASQRGDVQGHSISVRPQAGGLLKRALMDSCAGRLIQLLASCDVGARTDPASDRSQRLAQFVH